MNEDFGIRFILHFVRLWKFIRPKTYFNRLGSKADTEEKKEKSMVHIF